MTQQINLYHKPRRDGGDALGAESIARVLLVVIVILGAWWGWQSYRLGNLESRVVALRQQQTAAEDEIETLRQQYPVRQPSAALQAELERVRRSLVQTRGLANTLAGTGIGNAEGLSEYLVAMARQHVGGLWLTQVRVADGGQGIGLRGRSRVPQLVPEYVDRLAAEPPFSGKTFATLQLTRHVAEDDSDVSFVDFELRSRNLQLGEAP